MNHRIFRTLLVAGSLVTSAGYLPAQDNRKADSNQPTIEDRIGQLEQDGQNLKSQVDQLRNDVADLHERVKTLEGGKQPPQEPPPAARSSGSDRRGSAKTRTENSGEDQSYDVFYQRLQSGGHWFNDPTYGEVWQPEIAASDRNWRPYNDGHWAHTDRGWTWISNEDFGWATYHYGRWARRADNGWIWVPGTKWAPAWVSWRESNDHVGWAPLPPEVDDDLSTGVGAWVDNYYDIGPAAYSFVKISDLSRPSYREVVISPSEDVEFFSETRNVTNIAFDGDIVDVNGPRYERLESQARIPNYKLNYVTDNRGRFAINPRGDQLEVMAPPATLQRNASTQPKIEKTLGQAQVDRGWQQIDKQKAAQLKQAAAQQAPVPANLPPKPSASKLPVANAANQAPQTKQAPPSNAAQSTPPAQSTPVPEAQSPNAKSPPTPTPASERDRQAGQPPGNENNPRSGKPDQPPKASPPPQRAVEKQEPRQENPPPAPANTPRTEPQQPGGSSSGSKPSADRPEQKNRPTKPTNPPSEEPRDQAPAPQKAPPQARSNPENQPSSERKREPLNEPQKQMENQREQPANSGASEKPSRPESSREEPARNERSEQPRKQPEGEHRGEQRQSERANPDQQEKKEQKREKAEKPPPE